MFWYQKKIEEKNRFNNKRKRKRTIFESKETVAAQGCDSIDFGENKNKNFCSNCEKKKKNETVNIYQSNPLYLLVINLHLFVISVKIFSDLR